MGVSQKKRKRDTRPQVTYKGVSLETQTAVRKAAKKAKTTIGKWVDSSLLEAARIELGKKPPPPPLDINKEIAAQRELLQKVAKELQELRDKPTFLDRLLRRTPKK